MLIVNTSLLLRISRSVNYQAYNN